MRLFKTKPEFFESIDELPVYNWFKIHDTGDLQQLVKNPHQVSPKQLKPEELSKLWDKLYCEFIDTFGIDQYLKDILELKRDIEILKVDRYLYNDRSLETFIEIKQIELENTLKNRDTGKVEEVVAHVAKFMGFRLKPKDVSVQEFYTYLKTLENSIKASKHGG